MAKTDNLTDFLTDVANAIREKKGTTDPINPQNFSSEIEGIETGGASAVIKSGKFTGNGGVYTLQHDLGVMPDFILVYTMTTNTTISNYIELACGISQDLKSLIGFSQNQFGLYRSSNKSLLNGRTNSAIEVNSFSGMINSANESTVVIGNSNGAAKYTLADAEYEWVVIGGLVPEE